MFDMYKICFFVPVENAETVKDAIFLTGAGRIGNYDRCSWQTEGTGQFRPLSGSDPFVGSHGKTEQVPELKVELVCADDLIKKALNALKQAHPYEEPAYEIYRLEDVDVN